MMSIDITDPKCFMLLQYVEGMKLVTYALMDAVNGGMDEHVMSYYVSCASEVVMELVRKVHKVWLPLPMLSVQACYVHHLHAVSISAACGAGVRHSTTAAGGCSSPLPVHSEHTHAGKYQMSCWSRCLLVLFSEHCMIVESVQVAYTFECAGVHIQQTGGGGTLGPTA